MLLLLHSVVLHLHLHLKLLLLLQIQCLRVHTIGHVSIITNVGHIIPGISLLARLVVVIVVVPITTSTSIVVIVVTSATIVTTATSVAINIAAAHEVRVRALCVDVSHLGSVVVVIVVVSVIATVVLVVVCVIVITGVVGQRRGATGNSSRFSSGSLLSDTSSISFFGTGVVTLLATQGG